MSALAPGDLVTVHDPLYGDRRGRVEHVYPDGGVHIEGGRIDQARVWMWTIDADKIAQYVTPVA